MRSAADANPGGADQPRRGHAEGALDGFYEFLDRFEFIDADTNWLLLFNPEPQEPGNDGALHAFDATAGWNSLVCFAAHDRAPQRSSKTWAGGMALAAISLAVLVGLVFVPQSMTPPAVPSAVSPDPQPPFVSAALDAGADLATLDPALAVPAPDPPVVEQTLASGGPNAPLATLAVQTVPAPEPAAPALASLPAPAAPDIAVTAGRVPAVSAPAVTAALDVPSVVVPGTPTVPVPDPLPPAPSAPAAAAIPAPPPAVPATAAAPPPTAATASPAPAPAPAPAAAAAAVVPVRELETRAIQTVLGRYREAFNALDARAALAVWPGVNERDLARAFERIEEQHLSFDQCRIDVGGAVAEAACTGTARFVPRVGKRSAKAEARQWRFMFRKAASGWVIDQVHAR
jgi:hypothetical protein